MSRTVCGVCWMPECECPESETGRYIREHGGLGKVVAEHRRLRIALADAICRPQGVMPDSAIGLVTDAEFVDAMKRRPVSWPFDASALTPSPPPAPPPT